jgi:hypothetical protein
MPSCHPSKPQAQVNSQQEMEQATCTHNPAQNAPGETSMRVGERA